MHLTSSRFRARGTLVGGKNRGQHLAAAARRFPPQSRREGALSVTRRSHNHGLEVELGGGAVDVQQLAAAHAAGAAAPAPQSFDCLGLAQAMVDLSVEQVEDELLQALGAAKGSRTLVSLEQRAAVLERLRGREYAVAAGGSLSNTLVALARLGGAAAAARGEAPLRVGMAGLVGDDPLGEYYAAQMRGAGVAVASPPRPGTATGTVTVLTSPDAQRTMLSYLGTPAEVEVDAGLGAAIAASRLLVLEGYLWELPRAPHTIAKAIAAARAGGCLVAMTAGDAGVVERHHAEMWAAIDAGVDLLFTNAGEAAALLRHAPRRGAAPTPAAPPSPSAATAEQLALGLGPHCDVVVVTDGAAGSHIAALGQLHCVPPCWTEAPPVDSCGAGDAYAAGLLYAYLRGCDVVAMGRTAARVASAVIAKQGAMLSPEAAAALVDALPRSAARRSPAPAALAPSTPAS